ncbi:NUDIX hydrolase [Bavariicoccus seileri]|uniref:NUDIX hydrolase n=1 Tax=Bavariicoccus seileri TaxID=549685 RepID=UPI003F923096
MSNEDIRFKLKDGQFDVRACGILCCDKKVLVSHEDDGSQTLVGGAIHFGEPTEEAVVREFKEETGLSVRVKQLLGVVENFWQGNGQVYHQIVVVYYLVPTDSIDVSDVLQLNEKPNVQWTPEDRVVHLKPEALNQLVKQGLKKSNCNVQHFVNQ